MLFSFALQTSAGRMRPSSARPRLSSSKQFAAAGGSLSAVRGLRTTYGGSSTIDAWTEGDASASFTGPLVRRPVSSTMKRPISAVSSKSSSVGRHFMSQLSVTDEEEEALFANTQVNRVPSTRKLQPAEA